ncbi:ABC transporter permease [Halovivax cerinus]|uniref:ABC transporter permease n=1 Tax=Halovivax cerinus TaxID=1487865 RepID=A0ABD5NLE1_9EURY|nr:ABC transporter permease [Halovivax cerinus]
MSASKTKPRDRNPTETTSDALADESTSEPEVQAEFGLYYTLKQVQRDATARYGFYLIVFVSAVALFVTIDTYLSTLTFGRVDDFAIAEALPVLHHPETGPLDYETWQPPVWHPDGTWEYPLGTDQAGRDYLTRVIYGTRVSVTTGFVATLLGAAGGTTVGAVAGYYGGWVDELLMRGVEILYAIPPLVLVIVFTVFASGGDPDIGYAMLGVGIVSIPVFARIIRSRVLSVREMAYVEAARAAGVRDRTIIRRHVIPNSISPVVVYATLQIGFAILTVAGLSFLGYGAQPPTADWGEMLQRAQGQMNSNVWVSIWPGLAILLTVMGFNLLGDGLQDALDPRIDND